MEIVDIDSQGGDLEPSLLDFNLDITECKKIDTTPLDKVLKINHPTGKMVKKRSLSFNCTRIFLSLFLGLFLMASNLMAIPTAVSCGTFSH